MLITVIKYLKVIVKPGDIEKQEKSEDLFGTALGKQPYHMMKYF
jgi:hypothetical protein